MSSSLNTPIFREYLGGLEYFPDIVYSAKEEFHYILGIGTENYTTDGKGTGNFNIKWNYPIKKKYSNVKVILSFGGLGSEQPFNPEDKANWYTAAYNSIKGIITTQFKDTITIDGIDINYEYITPDSPDVFTSCIGELITKLKNDSDLSLNTFSISPSKLVQTHYSSLYWNYQNQITWINYQFYLHPVSSVHDFVKLYHDLVNKNIFPQSKLLPGGTTDPKYAGNLKPYVFIAGITVLSEENPVNPLAGAFVWNAYDSSVPPVPFYLEKITQDILTGGGA